MKNASFIFTRSRKGLDNQVWLSMLIVVLISVIAFSFKAITHISCTDFEISATGVRQQTDNIFYIGETVNFSASIPPQNLPEWDFGDGTPKQQIKRLIPHSFLKEGKFAVTCTINAKCQQTITIYIIATPSKPKDSISFIGNPIIGDDTFYLGGVGHFTTAIKANYSYQWSIGTSPDVPVQTTAAADFTFYKGGQQILQLRIDGAKLYTKLITVLPKKSSGTNTSANTNIPTATQMKIPPAISFIDPVSGGPGTSVTINGSFLSGAKSVSFGGQPAKIISVSSDQIIAEVGSEGASGAVVVITENGSFTFANPPFTYIAPKPVSSPPPPTSNGPQIVGITDIQLKKMLQQVVNNSLHAQDFDRYFCSGANTKVYANNDKAAVTFAQFCEKQLQGRKVEIESAHIVKDPDNPDCVTNLVVKYKKKKGFILF